MPSPHLSAAPESAVDRHRRESTRKQQEEFAREWEEKNGLHPCCTTAEAPPKPRTYAHLSPAQAVVMKAASELKQPFNLSDLAVKAWDKAHIMLGIDGYELLHPCTKKIRDLLYGPRGLLKKGLLISLGDGLYKIGEAKP